MQGAKQGQLQRRKLKLLIFKSAGYILYQKKAYTFQFILKKKNILQLP